MRNAKTYQLSFEIQTDVCPAELMATLQYYAEALQTSLVTEGYKADLVFDSEQVEDAPEKNFDGYDGAHDVRWGGC